MNETVSQFLPEVAQQSPCEQGEGPFTPQLYARALADVAIPTNELEWDVKNRTRAHSHCMMTALPLIHGSEPMRTNILVDFEAGTSAVNCGGHGSKTKTVFVSDDSGVRHFIRLDDETLYEQTPWLYSRE